MSELSEYRAALARALENHAYTYPDSFCECAAYIDGHRAWRNHLADTLLASPVLAQIVADAKAEERERVAQAIEAAGERAHAEFADEEAAMLRRVNADLGTDFVVGRSHEHDDGCSMCGLASAFRIAREPDTDRPDTAGEEKP